MIVSPINFSNLRHRHIFISCSSMEFLLLTQGHSRKGECHSVTECVGAAVNSKDSIASVVKQQMNKKQDN